MVEWGKVDEDIPDMPKLALANTFWMAHRTILGVFDSNRSFIDRCTKGTSFTDKPRYVHGLEDSLELETSSAAVATAVKEVDLLGDITKTRSINWHFHNAALKGLKSRKGWKGRI